MREEPRLSYALRLLAVAGIGGALLAGCKSGSVGGAGGILPAGSIASRAARPGAVRVVPFFDFRGGKYGANPVKGAGGYGGLIGNPSASLFGVTNAGGDPKCQQGQGCGLVYELTPRAAGAPYKETILYEFHGADGASPYASLTMGAGGALYGTTYFGGKYNLGTVFKVSPSKSGYSERVLYSFRGGRDGGTPAASLIFDAKGALYGTTFGGGGGYCQTGCGTVFKLTPSGSHHLESILYRFKGGDKGSNPWAGVLLIGDTLYGTTQFGGVVSCNVQPLYGAGCGVVYELKSSGKGYRVIHSFGGGKDGAWPLAGLTPDKDGVLYGVTGFGGGGGCQFGAYGIVGCGVVFRLTPSGSSYALTTVHVFDDKKRFPEGLFPLASLTLNHGFLYGTAFHGGNTLTCGGGDGCGVVFRLSTAGTAFQALHTFTGGTDGGAPLAPVAAFADALYGTTLVGGGSSNLGTAYKLTDSSPMKPR